MKTFSIVLYFAPVSSIRLLYISGFCVHNFVLIVLKTLNLKSKLVFPFHFERMTKKGTYLICFYLGNLMYDFLNLWFPVSEKKYIKFYFVQIIHIFISHHP